MWCSTCQQDVPGRTANQHAGGLCCPRCGRRLATDRGETRERDAAKTDKDSGGKSDAAAPVYDGWELDQQLRDMQSVLQGTESGHQDDKAAYRKEVARLDPPHVTSTLWHPAAAAKRAGDKKANPPQSPEALTMLAWTALSLGTMALACGGILLGWSLYADRAELWSIGLPIAIGGQVALLLGLILQLERLWHDSRQAAAKLETVDERLHELKTTTAMLGTTHSSAAGAFYSHLAEGATPQLLLSDLKSQLDLLALKMGQEDH